jgi:uncharacterized damage-inducible protein DinB
MSHYDLTWSDDVNPEIGLLVAALEDSTREWRENLEMPCPEAVGWAPYLDGPSIGGILLHMASCEQYNVMKLGEGIEVPDDDVSWAYDSQMDQYVPYWPTPPQEPIEWYFAVLDEARRRIIDIIRGHGDPGSIHQTQRFTMTYRWLLVRMIKHDSYHGGQTVLLHEMYKKMNG